MDVTVSILINLIAFIWSIAKVLIPLMIVIEIFKDTKLIDKLSNAIKPVTNFFTVSEQSGVSLVLGMAFGLTIGAGAIIQSVKDYNIDKRSVFIITIFLSLFHAVIEDSVLFAGAGANIFYIFMARLISATLITFILSRLIKKDA